MANWILRNELKEIIGVEDSYTQDDARIDGVIATATATLEHLLGRSLTKQSYVEYINSKNNRRRFVDIFGYSDSGVAHDVIEVKYYLKNYPVDTNGFEVHYQPNMLVDGSTQLDPSEYVLDAENGILIINKPTITYNRAIKVVYTAGYEATTVGTETSLSSSLPADLKQAVIFQACHLYDKQKMSNINVRESRSQGSTNSSRFVNIHAIAPEAMSIIVMYKRRNFTVV